METVARLYPAVRPGADYRRSLGLFAHARRLDNRMPLKSGLMLGLGESRDEVERVMEDLLAAGCTILTLGQYLQPTSGHMPVERFVLPEEFDEWREKALAMGFSGVASAPLVRSSYRAGELYMKAKERIGAPRGPWRRHGLPEEALRRPRESRQTDELKRERGLMVERDVIIVGGGPAGYAAAIRLAQLGRKATLVEKDTLGGTCLNSGCVPFMVLAKAVELLDMSKNGKDYGITFGETGVDFEKLSARRKIVTKIHVQGVKSLLEAYQTEVLQGSARFVSPSEIEVSTADGRLERLKGTNIIIAAGTTAAPPTLPGDEARSIDTNALLELPAPPSSIVILGGGFVSLTLATILAHLGSKVTRRRAIRPPSSPDR